MAIVPWREFLTQPLQRIKSANVAEDPPPLAARREEILTFSNCISVRHPADSGKAASCVASLEREYERTDGCDAHPELRRRG